MTNEKKCVVAEGDIKDRVVSITVVMPSLDIKNIIIKFYLEGKINGRAMEFIWPTDFMLLERNNNPKGRIEFSIPYVCMPFSDARLFLESGEELAYSEAYHLDKLYASSEEEFARNFFRTKKRVRSINAQIFACRQIRDYYFLNDGHRTVASVVLGYKALEESNSELMKEAIEWLNTQAQAAIRLSETDNPRTDAAHLALSTRMVLFQACLFLGKFEDMISHLEKARTIMVAIDAPMAVTSYNACRMGLLLGYLYVKMGKTQDSIRILGECFDFYVKSCAKIERNALLFYELGEAHRAAYYSLELIERIEQNRKHIGEGVVYEAVRRVRSNQSNEVMKENLNAFLRRHRIKLRNERNAQISTTVSS